MSKASRPRKSQPGMKRLTCYYWRTRGWCEHEEAMCLYAHRDTGLWAEEPKGKRNGVPSVAGKNARRPNPVRTNWRAKNGWSSPKEVPKVASTTTATTQGSFSTISSEPTRSFSNQTEDGSVKHHAIGAHARGSPSSKFTLSVKDSVAQPTMKQDAVAPLPAPAKKIQVLVREPPKPPQPTAPLVPTMPAVPAVPEKCAPPVTQVVPEPSRPSEPLKPKKEPVKSTGGLLLIAKTLRETAIAAANSRSNTLDTGVTKVQEERQRELTNRAMFLLGTTGERKVPGTNQTLEISKEQEEWFAQRAKYALPLRRYVERCWDPEMELANVFQRLHLWLPDDGKLPEEVKKLVDQREWTEKALRFYLGWIRLYINDIFEMRRAGRPEALAYAVWGLDRTNHYLDIALPRLHAALQMVENNLAARAVQYGLGLAQPPMTNSTHDGLPIFNAAR